MRLNMPTARPAESSVEPSIFSAASVMLHVGFIITGIVMTLLGPILPILIARWSLSDQRAGLFFTAQFCGSLVGIASLGPLMRRGYRLTILCGFILIALGVAGLNSAANLSCMASAALFGCGLGQCVSATNLWVAEVGKARRVAALSILNFAWGIGAIGCPPLVLLAQRRGHVPELLFVIAGSALLVAIVLSTMHFEPGDTHANEIAVEPKAPVITKRSGAALAAMFFVYVGTESSVSGWVAALAKRVRPDPGNLWLLAPMFFWAGLLVGRAILPLVPGRFQGRAWVIGGIAWSAACVGLLMRAGTFAAVAVFASATALGFAGVYPILLAWLVDAFGERSKRIGVIMFALGGMGGATMPWLVGVESTLAENLRAGLLVPLTGCVAILALAAIMREKVFRGAQIS
jgi:fucose permease